ncbi:MAG: restriction endonuclease [Clostridia bacterium]|nr:restriction endonuclease [Clostridia bacterium]
MLLDGLLSVVDFVCEGVAGLFVGLLRGLLAAVRLLLRGLIWLLGHAARLAAWPVVFLLRRLGGRHNRASRCLRLSGEEFEHYVALLLKDHYYHHVELTKGSGDQGVDILCDRGGVTYAIQCKNYDGAVGNFAVQEAYAGAQFYGCDVPVVVCPGTFTRGAIELAESTGVELWDGAKLSRMMRRSGRRPKHL